MSRQKTLLFYSYNSVQNPNNFITGNIFLDATVQEAPSFGAQITQHQVEIGPNDTDHIRPLPGRLSLQAIISNTPIDIPSDMTGHIGPMTIRSFRGARNVAPATGATPALWIPKSSTIANVDSVLQFSAKSDRAKVFFDQILAAAMAGAIWVITTTLATYDKYAITGFSPVRNADNGNDLVFGIDFGQIVTVDTQLVSGPAAKHQPKKRSVQPPKEVTAPAEVAAVNDSWVSTATGVK